MPEHPTDAHFSFTFVFKQALKPQNRELEAGDIYLGPLTAYQKDSILTAERIDLNQMNHKAYE